MMNAFLFAGLPYIAIATAIIGCFQRIRNNRFSMSARSSQFLEDQKLLWGSVPWHIGIIVVMAGHLIAFLIPKVWSSILSVRGALLTIETIGIACSLLALSGLLVLSWRRVTTARVQAVTTTADHIVVVLLLLQVIVGLASAVQFRYGAAWSTGTVVPYLWGLLTLSPDMSYVTDFPTLFKLHLVGGWLLLLTLPFTRLLHVVSIPVPYFFRSPQIVIWNSRRAHQGVEKGETYSDGRRAFFKGASGIALASGLMALGFAEKIASFFKGPRPDAAAEGELLQKKLERLEITAEERAYELERQRNDMILVCRYSELKENKGKYFTDYLMRPGLAFKGSDGLPIVISAKCTHLGCTVASDLDSQGRVLCPCHISYFDIQTGKPNDGAPAKAPLPQIAWALIDASGKVAASRRPGQPIQGRPDANFLAQCNLYITKPGRDIT